jgi:hypothetical protein
MKLLVDMNLSPRWVHLLTAAGIEAAHWSTLGAANAPDAEIMAFAACRITRRQGPDGVGMVRQRHPSVHRAEMYRPRLPNRIPQGASNRLLA